MTKVTSVTMWNDAVGARMSITYSVIDETTGTVTADNKRIDRLVLDTDAVKNMQSLMEYAQTFVTAAVNS